MEKNIKRKTRANESLINILRGMKNRCYYSNTPNHKRNYRDKGIRICDQWLANAASFDKWALDNGWKPGLTIDRINSNGNYDPGNCQFLTLAENIRRSVSAKLTWDQVIDIRARFKPGRNGNRHQLAAEFGVRPNTINEVVRGVNHWQVDER